MTCTRHLQHQRRQHRLAQRAASANTVIAPAITTRQLRAGSFSARPASSPGSLARRDTTLQPDWPTRAMSHRRLHHRQLQQQVYRWRGDCKAWQGSMKRSRRARHRRSVKTTDLPRYLVTVYTWRSPFADSRNHRRYLLDRRAATLIQFPESPNNYVSASTGGGPDPLIVAGTGGLLRSKVPLCSYHRRPRDSGNSDDHPVVGILLTRYQYRVGRWRERFRLLQPHLTEARSLSGDQNGD